jgi:hypothetical protein
MRPEMRTMRCPFLRTMLSAPDAPKWNPRTQVMNVEDMIKFVRDEPPGDGTLHQVLRFITVANHGVGNRVQRLGRLVMGTGGQFSTELTGSDGDHEGDSRIYNPQTGEFDPEQFARFTRFSADGETMDVAALGQAIADANQRHTGTPVTAVQSAGEFALLSILLGDTGGTIKIKDMKRLFLSNRFSASARKNLRTRTAEMWLDLTLKITDGVSRAATAARYRPREMKAERLKQLVEVLFSPLLSSMSRNDLLTRVAP